MNNLIKAADDLAAAVLTAVDYASDASNGYLWHVSKKDGKDALVRLDKETGSEDLDRFTSALTAYRAARESAWEVNADGLKPCPFCGSHDVKQGGDDKVVGVWCQNCQASGPNGYLTINGEFDWNTRSALAE